MEVLKHDQTSFLESSGSGVEMTYVEEDTGGSDAVQGAIAVF